MGLGPHSNYIRAARFALPFRSAIAAAALITVVLAALTAVEPLVLKIVFDRIGSPDAMRVLAIGVMALVGAAIVREIAEGFTTWLVWKTRLGIQYAILERVVERLQSLPLEFYRKQGVGSVLTRVDRSIQGLVEAIARLAFQILPAVVYLALAVLVMARLSPPLAALVLLFAPLPAWIQSRAAPRQLRRERELLDRWSRIYARFGEVLSGIAIVRAFGMEGVEKRRFLGRVSEANGLVSDGVAADARTAATSNLVVALARVAALSAGGVLVIRGEITVGTVVAFLGYVSGLFAPVQGLGGTYQALQKARVSLDEIFAMLDGEVEVPDRPGAKAPRRVRGAIAFEGVRFSYDPRERPVLDGVDFRIEPGETVALVGPSGTGKTTVGSLILRLHEPREGVVRIDGEDVRRLQKSWIRTHVAAVHQEPLLFNDTVAANIAFGRPTATRAEIEAAARAAYAHEFVVALPQGYDTVVGERGARLSLGERQRITIARAFVKDAPVLLLDEATSSLDGESEALIQASLERLRSGRTVLVIAHRLSTVIAADRILVLQRGRISDSGTHAELLHRSVYYAGLVDQQTRALRGVA